MSADANRRSTRRLPPRGRIRITCRRGGSDLGPDLAVGLLDLSASGAYLTLRAPLDEGQEVRVSLDPVSAGRSVVRLAEVTRCAPEGDGYRTGLRFRRPLDYAELSSLARL